MTDIVNEFIENGLDLALLREVGLLIKRKDLDVNLLPSSVRLRKRLGERGLDEMKIDSFIDIIDVHAFRRGISVEQFVATIYNLFSLEEQLGMPLDQLPQHLAKSDEEIKNRKNELKNTRIKIRKYLQASNTTMNDLEDYKIYKNKLQNYETLQSQADELLRNLNWYKSPGIIVLDINEEQLKVINTVLTNQIYKPG